MKRLYTVGYYREMLQRSRETIPEVAISSDFIVGFCGETEPAFEKCLDLVREAKFKNSFIFKYSPRPGTKAHELYADDVPEDIKKRRNNDLLGVQNEVSRTDHRRIVGQIVEVLVEGPSKHGVHQLTGRTMTDHIVVFDGPTRLTGQLIDVQITDASPFTLFGAVETGEFVGLSNNDNDRSYVQSPSRIELPMI